MDLEDVEIRDNNPFPNVFTVSYGAKMSINSQIFIDTVSDWKEGEVASTCTISLPSPPPKVLKENDPIYRTTR